MSESQVLLKQSMLIDAYHQLAQVIPPSLLEERRLGFLSRFGLEQLQQAHGTSLLELFHGNAAQQTRGLIYNIEVEPTLKPFGGVKGGSALKFKVYRGWTDQQFYRKGPGKEPVPATDAEALEITESLARSMVRGLALAGELGLDAGDYDSWLDFEQRIRQIDGQWVDKSSNEMPILELGWVHKYLGLVRPDLFSFHHQYHALAQHLIRLGLEPEAGRFTVDWQWRNLRMNNPDFSSLYSPLLMSASYKTFGEETGYWRVGTEEGPQKVARWPAMRNGGFASIGWGFLGDLRMVLAGLTGPAARDRIAELLQGHSGQAKRTAGQILAFYEGMEQGDRIAAMRGATLHGVGVVSGDYEYVEGDLQPHHRRVDWKAEPDMISPGFPGLQTTVKDISGSYHDCYAIEGFVANDSGLGPDPLPVPPDDVPPPETITLLPLDEPLPLSPMQSRIREVLARKGQVILYGPPGTGKTYHAKSTARELVARELFGGRAWANLNADQQTAVEQSITVCTFHPAYGYEDFVEGYRPKMVNGQPTYELVNGIFRDACDSAAREPERHHILIVDEINRGNVAAVMGELITLIEQDKRGKELVVLALSRDKFTVPPNLWIIGTMNTADRSISLLDAALRRRFGFIELLPDCAGLHTRIGDLSLEALLTTINERIRRKVRRNARELQVGHAFLMKGPNAITSKDELHQVMRDDIIPLLAEYCFENYAVVAEILSVEIIDIDAQAPRFSVVNDAEALYTALLQLVQQEPLVAPLQDIAGDETGAESAEDVAENGDDE